MSTKIAAHIARAAETMLELACLQTNDHRDAEPQRMLLGLVQI
jgi:hypothetical protein